MTVHQDGYITCERHYLDLVAVEVAQERGVVVGLFGLMICFH